MPAKVGIQKYQVDIKHWTPAFAGVTRRSDVWIPAPVPVCPGPDPGSGIRRGDGFNRVTNYRTGKRPFFLQGRIRGWVLPVKGISGFQLPSFT